MKAVIQKAWADLWGRPWQSVLIIVSVAAAATLLYLGLVSLFASSSPYEKQMARAHGAHAWFYLPTGAEGEAAAGRVDGRAEVSKSARQQVARSFLVAPEVDKVPWVDVIPQAPGETRPMGYLVLEGRDLQAGDRGAALLNASIARYMHVAPGNSIRVQTQDGPQKLEVVGLVADPKYCTFPRCQPQGLYVLPETFAGLSFPAKDQGTLLGVWLTDPQGADRFVSQTRQAEAASLKEAYSWQAMQDFYTQDRLFSVVPVLLFGVMAVVAAAMVLAMIIGGAVLGQYREIGVLKALGFSRGQVLLLYVGQTLLLSFLGGALGVTGGHIIAVRSMAPLARSMGTPDVLHFSPVVAALAAGVLLPVAGVFAALACWRAVAASPAAMLADGFGVPRARTPLAVKALAWARLPVPVQLGVKDAVARPARAALTILSLTVGLVTITLGLNFPGIADQIWQHRDLIGINWDMTVEPNLLPPDQTERAVKDLPNLQGFYRETFLAGTAVDQEFVLGVRAVDGDWDQFGFRLMTGRLPQEPGEVLLGPRAWERLGAKLGTRLSLQIGEQAVPVTVVGEYQEQINNGRMVLMPRSTLRAGWPDVQGRDFLRVKLQPGADWMAARRSLLEQTGYRPLVTLEDQQLPDFARDVVAMMRLLAWVMAGIAGISILGAALLTVKEQMREIGIRKAVGMSPAQVLTAVVAGGAWLGLVAVALALPSSYGIQKALTTVMTRVMGVGGMPLALPGSVLALAAVAGLGLAVVAVLPAAILGIRFRTAWVLHAE